MKIIVTDIIVENSDSFFKKLFKKVSPNSVIFNDKTKVAPIVFLEKGEQLLIIPVENEEDINSITSLNCSGSSIINSENSIDMYLRGNVLVTCKSSQREEGNDPRYS